MVSESVSLKFIFWRIFVFDLISHWVFPGIWPWMPAANFSPSSTVESSVVRKVRERRIRRILFQKYGGQFPRTYGHLPLFFRLMNQPWIHLLTSRMHSPIQFWSEPHPRKQSTFVFSHLWEQASCKSGTL